MKALQEIKERAENATVGPWVDYYGALCIDVSPQEYFKLAGPNIQQGPPFTIPKRKENMDFIVASRQDVPNLIAALELCIEKAVKYVDYEHNENLEEQIEKILTKGADDAGWEV